MTVGAYATARCGYCGAGTAVGRWCTVCGAPPVQNVQAGSIAQVPAAAPRQNPWGIVAAVVAGLLVVAVIAAVAFWPGAATVVPAVSGPAASAAAVPVAASASCQRPDSVDAAGNPTSYGPTQAIDGAMGTAWRCGGSGVGESLTVSFPGPTRVSAVGIVPGLSKTDPADGTDRYAQNRRITLVRLTADDGATTTVALDPSVSVRGLQWNAFSTTTTTLTVTVLASVPGTAQNGQAPNDTTAVSEVALA